MVAGGQGAGCVASHHAADIGGAGDVARGVVAGGHGAVVVSHHAADTGGAGDVARGSAGGHGAVVVSHHAANNVAAGYIHVFQRQVLHRATGVEEVNHPHIVSILVDSQPRDGMVAAVEGAGVSVIVVSYRRPLFASKVDVVGQGAVQQEVALYGFVPCQQAVGVVDLVGIAVLRHGVSRVFCRGEGDGVGIFLARFPFGSPLHPVGEGLAVVEGAGDEGRTRCHRLRGYERGVGVAALVMRGDYSRVSILGGEACQPHEHLLLGVVRQDDGDPRRAVGEAECGVAVAHRLFLGYDEVAALEVFPGTLVGSYLHGRRGCLASGVGPPRRDGDVIVVGPVVRLIGGQRGAGVVGGGGRHVVCLHRAANQDAH